MNDAGWALFERKNKWLAQQVEVKFPTAESLKGKALYESSLSQAYIEKYSLGDLGDFATLVEDWYLVDFHRLTIMFAMLQSERWPIEEHQQLIVEFLTQIILEPAHQLYLGFCENTPCAAAIISSQDNDVLLSDIVLSNKSKLLPQCNENDVINSLLSHLALPDNSTIWVEKR
jgi:hypothetical protein